MKKNSKEEIEILSLMDRMDKHLTLSEAEQYRLCCQDELMEYMWLKPNITGLNVDIFVDDGGSYKRNNHELLLFVRNGYGREVNEFIPISISKPSYVLDSEMEFGITYYDIYAVQDFIEFNLDGLINLANGNISQEEFVENIKISVRKIVENKERLNEMATLKMSESHLPVDIWIEASGKIEEMCKKFKAFNVPCDYIKIYLNNIPYEVIDEYHYSRYIRGTNEIKTIFGFKDQESFEILKNNINDKIMNFMSDHKQNGDTISENINKSDDIYKQYLENKGDLGWHESIINYFIYLKDDEMINEYPKESLDILKNSINFLMSARNKIQDKKELFRINGLIDEGKRIIRTSTELVPIAI